MENNITLTSVQYNKETDSFTVRYFSQVLQKEEWIEMDPESTLQEMISAVNAHEILHDEIWG